MPLRLLLLLLLWYYAGSVGVSDVTTSLVDLGFHSSNHYFCWEPSLFLLTTLLLLPPLLFRLVCGICSCLPIYVCVYVWPSSGDMITSWTSLTDA